MHYAIPTLSTPDIYRLLTGGVVPRPIAWVSTRSSQGVDNLAPFSFFTVVSVQPPVLAVVQVNPSNRPAKDTLANLRATKECVVNVVTQDLLDHDLGPPVRVGRRGRQLLLEGRKGGVAVDRRRGGEDQVANPVTAHGA